MNKNAIITTFIPRPVYGPDITGISASCDMGRIMIALSKILECRGCSSIQ
jgi:hypothetical protein